jgi:filamentous hemagglutinin
VATATVAAAAATAGAASAASTSFGTGMYGAGYLNTTATGVKNTTETSLSKASNFIGYGDIDIASNNNLNVLGSMLSSVNGNVTLAADNDIKIEAGTNTLSQKSKQETIYGGGSVGNNGVQLNIGLSQGESEYNKTFYTNSQIGAENGTLTLNTGNDANISGANLLAKNVALNIGNNLNVSSKQTEEDFSSSGFGFNFGVGVGAGGNGGNVGGGFNMSNADMHRLWVDDITTIKGTDSMAVNVGKDLNLTGAAILSDNLALAVTGNTNKKELSDSYYSESMSIGVSRTMTVGSGSQATVTGTGGQPNQFPGGSTTINGSYNQNESNRTTYATIGGLDSTLTSATKDIIGADFEGSLTLDHRLFSEAGRNQIGDQLNGSF